MKGLIIAIQFLTRLPTPRVAVSDAVFAASMRWFPAVGLIVGAIVAAGGRAGAAIDPWTGALLALLLWVAVTGALHLDGLGDIADARGAHRAAVRDDERRGRFKIGDGGCDACDECRPALAALPSQSPKSSSRQRGSIASGRPRTSPIASPARRQRARSDATSRSMPRSRACAMQAAIPAAVGAPSVRPISRPDVSGAPWRSR